MGRQQGQHRVTADLYRDGRIVHTVPGSGAIGRTYIVPCPPPVHTIREAMDRPALPAEVIADRYNSDFDHYFPEVEVCHDVYRLTGKVREGHFRYDYWKTETMKHRQR
jgi:hypothetical protein